MNVSDSVPAERVRALLWWALLAVSALAAAAAGFLARPETRIGLWLHLGTPLVELSLVFALLLALPDVWPALRSALRAESRRNDLAALGILLLASLAMLRLVHPEMRMQADESALVGTSFGLHLTGLPLVPSAGYYDTHGELHMLATNMDKRGLLFPILLNGMHALFGYSAAQGLRLNALLTLLIPALAYAGLRRHMGAPGALAGALLVLAHPVLIWCGASSGFEPLNAVLILVGWLAVQAAARSGSVRRWLLVAVLGALAAQVRYESVLFGAALFAIGSAVCARRPESNWRWGLALVPVLYLPFAWQRALAFDFGLGEKGAEPFAPSYFADNVGHALALFALPSAIEPIRILAYPPRTGPGAGARAREGNRRPRCDSRGTGCARGGTDPDAGDLFIRLGEPDRPVHHALWSTADDPDEHLVWARATLDCSALALAQLAGSGASGADRGGFRSRHEKRLRRAAPVSECGREHRDRVGAHASVALSPAVRRAVSQLISSRSATQACPRSALASTWPNVRAWAREGNIDSVWFVEVWNLDTGTVVHKAPDGFSADELYAVRLPWQIGVRILALDRADAPLGRDCRPETATSPAERDP